MFALELYRIKCPRCKSENIYSISSRGKYQCKKCRKIFSRFIYTVFILANMMAFFIMFCKVYESYALDWLKNHHIFAFN
ncbi:MAG: hypothetical protein COY39_03455 [Alphaproteobacteria bacterium CG_4_10_14_0_8_um_filter_37_21]|nr:MAG: hypothetical protein COY39_03455 [Alphaproteobacteria bacterium CG_4_10_14_0_8_um_filter_37_21]